MNSYLFIEITVTMASLMARRVLLSSCRNFSLTKSAMADFLINGKYSVLKELGLSGSNHGVYNGRWRGSGQVSNLKKNIKL